MKTLFILIFLVFPLISFGYSYQCDSFVIDNGQACSKKTGDRASVKDGVLSRFYRENAFTQRCPIIKSVPTFSCNDPLLDYLYKLAVSEVYANISPDKTFYAGAKWQGVWTRDSSYAIDLALWLLEPEIARRTLEQCVKNNIIQQDTGSGGSYPISTDRVVWAMAAYRLALLFDDDSFSRYVYDAVENALNYDGKVCFDSDTGLYRGETSFLDWREQTYPAWMDCNEIGASFSLSTNVLHKLAFDILANLADKLGLPDKDKWINMSFRLGRDIYKHFALKDKHYFANFIDDGIYRRQSHTYDNLAHSLLVIAGIIDGQAAFSALNALTVGDYGMPVVSPQIKNIPNYHNNAVWPFVQAYRALAAKRIGDINTVVQEFSAMVYNAAVFGTFKENMTSDEADSEATETNSDRQLWSDAGFLAFVYRVLFGIDILPDGVAVRPMVFDTFDGGLSLQNVKIGEMTLNIKLSGTGSKIRTFRIDGREVDSDYIVPRDSGSHTIEIVLESEPLPWNERQAYWAANDWVDMSPTVAADAEGGRIYLEWEESANKYEFLHNNKPIKAVKNSYLWITPDKNYINLYEIRSPGSEITPVFSNYARSDNAKTVIFVEAENADYTGGAFSDRSDAGAEPTAAFDSLELNTLVHNGSGYISKWGAAIGDKIVFPINVKKVGVYAIDFRYQNGHGPVNTGSQCAIAAVRVDNQLVRRIPFAQRGSWLDWGFTHSLCVPLDKGIHNVSLVIDDYCRDLQGRFNYINVDMMRVGRVRR